MFSFVVLPIFSLVYAETQLAVVNQNPFPTNFPGSTGSTTGPYLPYDGVIQPSASSGFCTLGNNPKFQDLISYVTCLISKSVIPLIFALATVVFIWGVVQYVINTDDEKKKSKGREFMIWGIIGLTVMFSIWGLVSILANTFNIDVNFVPQVRP